MCAKQVVLCGSTAQEMLFSWFFFFLGFGAKTEKLEVHSFCLKMWTVDDVFFVISIIIVAIITIDY